MKETILERKKGGDILIENETGEYLYREKIYCKNCNKRIDIYTKEMIKNLWAIKCKCGRTLPIMEAVLCLK